MFKENLGIKRYFEMQRLVFAGLGLDPTSEEHMLRNPLLAFVPMFAAVSFCACILRFTVEHISDVRLATESFSTFCAMMLACWKYVMFWYNHREIVSLVRRIWQLNLAVQETERPILAAENAKDIRFNRSYCTISISASIFAICPPLLSSLLSYMRHGIVELEPPFKATFPFDYHRIHWYYVLVIAWSCCVAYFVVSTSVAIDGLFSWCMYNTVAQFRILQQRLQLTAAAQPGDPSMPHLVACLQYHRKLLETAQDFKAVFRGIIFVKFAISGLQICCESYQITRSDTPADMMFHTIFVLVTSLQLMIYCYGGTRLQQESESIATAIYVSFPWHNMSTKVRKLLVFPIMRSHKGCTLSGIFFVLNLEVYLRVLRSAASFIALLWTLDEKAN